MVNVHRLLRPLGQIRVLRGLYRPQCHPTLSTATCGIATICRHPLSSTVVTDRLESEDLPFRAESSAVVMGRMRVGIVLALSLTVVSALDWVYDERVAAANTKESRLTVEKEHVYQHQLRQCKSRMRAQVDAMTHKRSKWMTGHVQCLLRENAPVHRQEEVLHWICSPEGANSTCKGIKPGGAHFYPNTTSDHLCASNILFTCVRCCASLDRQSPTRS